MKTVYGNLFDFPSDDDAICVTTNGITKSNGEAVMGAGIAKAFAIKYPELPVVLGDKLTKGGNHAYYLLSTLGKGNDIFHIFSLPTKHDWRDRSDLVLIKQSCRELMALIDCYEIRHCFFPLPGCGLGGLSEDDVVPVIEQILDDRFVLVKQ